VNWGVAWAARAALGAAVATTACTSTQSAGHPNGTIIRSVSRVAPGQTGLEVVRWQVQDDGARLEDALRAHSAPAVAGMSEQALRANGFVIWPVKRSELDAMLMDMGGSYLDVRTWFGQVTSWREIAAAPVGDALLEVDGVAHERPGAVARLMLRSWALPMEDGTRIAVELVPQIVVGESQSSLLRNGDRLGGEVAASCAAELELDHDVAWVVTCDPSRQIKLKLPDAPSPPPEVAEAPQDMRAPGQESVPAPPPDAPPIVEPSPPQSKTPPLALPPTLPPPPPAQAPPPEPPPPTGADRVPPAPALKPASAENPRQRAPRPQPAPPPQGPHPSAVGIHPIAIPWSAIIALCQVPPDPSGAEGSRVVTLGVQLLLASPEGAGVPSRRTVIILVPHLEGSPFPVAPSAAPMSP
jgi:hypothetical protein